MLVRAGMLGTGVRGQRCLRPPQEIQEWLRVMLTQCDVELGCGRCYHVALSSGSAGSLCRVEEAASRAGECSM